MPASSYKPRAWRAVAIALPTLILSACQSLDQIAPPVTAADPSGRLHVGRDLYVTRCAKCHAPEPVTDYTKSEWEKIIVEMSEETNLTEPETEAVRAYVMAVLAGRMTGPQEAARRSL